MRQIRKKLLLEVRQQLQKRLRLSFKFKKTNQIIVLKLLVVIRR
jgi:hypothetical protein